MDTGIDDALAIGYAARSSDLELIGLTTCFGNVSLQKATRNTLYVLERFGEDTPVAPGADRTLSGRPLKAEAFAIHGKDGLGEAFPHNVAIEKEPVSQHASQFIIDQIKTNPHEVTLICVGPLTNLALSLEQEPGIVDLVDRVIIMGGAVTVRGNVTPYAEANIYADPEAAQAVLSSRLPITLVGLDVTMKTLLSHEKVQQWRAKGELGRFLADMTDFYINAYEKFSPGIGGCGLHDPLAVGVAIDATFVETKPMPIQVDLAGESMGRTFSDLTEKSGFEPKVDVCLEVDHRRFLDHFIQTII